MRPDQRATFWRDTRHVLDTPCGLRFIRKEQFGDRSVSAEVVNLPLTDQDGLARFIVGLHVDLDIQELMGRDGSQHTFGDVDDFQYFDIGAGI